MNYLSMLTEDEIKYICSVIPIEGTVLYFKRYPKEFAKIMPGFRPSSFKSQEQVGSLLFRSREQNFISSFIEKHIKRWLREIQDEIDLKINEGESKEAAWMQTLPFCFFVDNISIFFKLIGEEYPEQYISIISVSIKRIKYLDVSKKRFETMLNEEKSEVIKLKDDINCIQSKLEKSREKLIESSNEIKELKRIYADVEKLQGVVQNRDNKIDFLKKKIQERDEYIKKSNDELYNVIENQKKIETEIKKQKVIKLIEQASSLNPRCPSDIEEFSDYLGYNLESLGVATDVEYYALLKEYICEILFQGKPVIINRTTGVMLMRCVSNTLVGSVNVATLSFSLDVMDQQIDEFLSAKNRIFCLDNFIGNYNEMTLMTICDKHRDKIIFLTTTYDRTLLYIPEEFLKYCNYINLNRIKSFTCEFDLTEEPSTFDEVDASYSIIAPNACWSSLLKEMLYEFGISRSLATYKSSLISDEKKLCRILAFDVLPFCVDVLNISPFNVSERLNKYVGEKGRCPYKKLFRRWFI